MIHWWVPKILETCVELNVSCHHTHVWTNGPLKRNIETYNMCMKQIVYTLIIKQWLHWQRLHQRRPACVPNFPPTIFHGQSSHGAARSRPMIILPSVTLQRLQESKQRCEKGDEFFQGTKHMQQGDSWNANISTSNQNGITQTRKMTTLHQTYKHHGFFHHVFHSKEVALKVKFSPPVPP